MIAKETQQNTPAKRALSLYALVLVLLLSLSVAGEIMVDPLRDYLPTDAVFYFAERSERDWLGFGMRADGSTMQIKSEGKNIIASGLGAKAEFTQALPHLAPIKNILIALRGSYGILQINHQERLAEFSRMGSTINLKISTPEDATQSPIELASLPGTLMSWSSLNEPIAENTDAAPSALASGLYGSQGHPEAAFLLSGESARLIFEKMIKSLSLSERSLTMPDGDTIPEQIIDIALPALKNETTRFGVITKTEQLGGPVLLNTTPNPILFQSQRATQETSSLKLPECAIDRLISFYPNIHLVVGRGQNDLVFCIENNLSIIR